MFIEVLNTDGQEVLINLNNVIKFTNDGPQDSPKNKSMNVVKVMSAGGLYFSIVMEWDELLKIITEVQNEKNQVSH